MSFIFDNKIEWSTKFRSQTVDAGGRARTSFPFLDFTAEFPFNKRLDLWDEQIVGSATSTHDPDSSSVLMETSTASGDRVTRQTKQFFRYQPGSSGAIHEAFVAGTTDPNCVKRVGFGNEDNGFFIEINGSTVRFNRRTSVTGSSVDNIVNQSNWNIDKLDGTGPSGITLDITKIQNFVVAYEWYGAGLVKFGFKIGGEDVWAHVIEAANNLSTATLGTPILPVKYEIENIGTTATSNSLRQFGSSVIREGGSLTVGVERAFDNGTSPKAVGTGSFVPLLSIRLKSQFVRGQIVPRNIQVFNTSKRNLKWELVLNPTLTGASWVSASDLVEGDVSATAATGGQVLFSGYVSEASSSTPDFRDVDLRLGGDIDGNSDIFTIRAISIDQAGDSASSISWKEVD